MTDSQQIVSRIAPTPSGFLHIGNALNFIFTQHLVKQKHGKLLLRIDDLDKIRTRNEYVDDIFENLDWLGIQVVDGPKNTDDFWKNHSQASRTELYKEFAMSLYERRLAYACDCSRTDVRKLNPSGQYTGHCRDRNLPFEFGQTALRLKTEATSKPLCDFVIWRRDNIPAYHVVSVLDDIRLGVNLIVRGQELFDSSEAQKILAQKSGLDEFLKIEFVHHPVIKGVDGEKLSKSANAYSLKEMRATGVTADEIYRRAEEFFGMKLVR